VYFVIKRGEAANHVQITRRDASDDGELGSWRETIGERGEKFGDGGVMDMVLS